MARIRSSRREKPAVQAATARDIDFGHLWREPAGWTSKRPTGLQTDWRYSSPDESHVFVGEIAVVNYVFKSGLLEDMASDGQVHTEYGDEAAESAAEEHNTIDAMFGSSSEDEMELSQAAVSRAFGLSPGDLQVDDEERDAAASLNLLSEASGLEMKGDVNYVLDEEESCDYEDYSSGVSEDDGMRDDDSDIGCDGLDEDEDVLSDSEGVGLDEAFLASLPIGNCPLSRAAVKEREEALRAMKWTPVSSQYETDKPPYPGLGVEEARPNGELLDVWRSPLLTLLYFMPKSLWVLIATETNRYGLQQVDKRTQDIHARQSDSRRETAKQITRRLKAQQAYGTHEILHVVGQLVARMLCPQKRRFSAHWTMVEDGALPAGSFGRYMTRDRCQNIMRDLHFVDNTTANRHDKLWKLHPVVDRIQQQFLAGWSLPAVFSFDEGVLSTSKRNPTRMFMSDKPHRYGSKLFMMCDAKTAYCHRFEVYVGRRSTADATVTAVDYKTGAAAVVRNLKVVLDDHSRHKWHAIVIDRYYSSVLLAVELLAMEVYVVGTVMINRLGLDKNIKSKRKTRPAKIPRGAFSFSRSVAIPSMITYIWWDRKPVYYLCFLDMVMVNAYLSHKEATKIKKTVAMKRSEWFCVLQNQLLQLKADDFAGVDATPPRSIHKRKRTPGVGKTCYDIWHEDFGAGEDIPASIRKRVVLRRPGKKAGRRQKTRRELQLAGQGNDGGNNSGDGDDENDN
ncbi:hypothetical protein PHMEG_00018154 [Phytophthora megakarya]|uniref:PiggyBac transposable element-derived protein domain-containing protein n=1 Tax=Phytophthora megakarya TaxID=4795 RepID=A0A225VV09_9STRA|nr:hypothetical protein PHMEG_00018154 [Phytophthora megakarya]